MTDEVETTLVALCRRESILRRLAEGPRRKREIEPNLDCSRSTLDRALRSLSDLGLVERCNGKYRLTLRGRLALQEYERFADRMCGIQRAAPVVDSLPPNCPLCPAVLEDCDVITPDRSAPSRPVERYLSDVREAAAIRAVGRVVTDRYVAAFREAIIDEDAEARITLAESGIRRLLTGHRAFLERTLSLDRFELREIDEEPPFSFCVLQQPETTLVSIMVYSANGASGYLRSDSTEAVEWAESLFDDYWQRSTEIPV